MKNLTASVDAAYEQTMERIKSQPGSSDAMLILSWMVFAKRPLTVKEIQHALAICLQTPSLDHERIIEEEVLGTLCSGLIIIESSSHTLQWAHSSARGYFERTKHQWFQEGEVQHARSCIDRKSVV